ncbi:hypothetical protein ABE527_20895 [Brucella sp. TWI432]
MKKKKPRSDVSWEPLPDQIGKYSLQGKYGELQVLCFDPKGILREQYRGEFSTHNFSKFHSEGNESSLSQILMTDTEILEPYFLTKSAKTGLLNRAAKRNKKLKPELLKALSE